MSILQLPRERKEVEKTNRSRVLEEERKRRIFKTNYQVYVDSSALKAQVEEKKSLALREQQAEEAFYQHETDTVRQATALAEKMDKQKRQIIEDMIQYQQNYQRPEQRREFDLNDPDFLKKSKPARISDDDPTLTVSSAQVFEGEDRSLRDRRKKQADQLRSWLEEQMRDRKLATEYERKSQEEFMEYLTERDRRATQLEQLERECSRHMKETIGRYNALLAEQRRVEKQRQDTQNIQNDQAEMVNTANSDLLTEPLEIGFMSAFGPGRINCPMYKGMTPAMVQGIREIQRLQREERQRKKEEEEQNERRWQELMESQARRAVENNEQIQQKQKQMQCQLAADNRLLSQLQEEKMNHFNKFINVNVPTSEYFNKFNTSSR